MHLCFVFVLCSFNVLLKAVQNMTGNIFFILRVINLRYLELGKVSGERVKSADRKNDAAKFFTSFVLCFAVYR